MIINEGHSLCVYIPLENDYDWSDYEEWYPTEPGETCGDLKGGGGAEEQMKAICLFNIECTEGNSLEIW